MTEAQRAAYDRALEEIAALKSSGATAWTVTLEGKYSDLVALPSEISRLSALRVLDLSYTSVSDLAPLASLTALQSLKLRNTQVTDLIPLAGLSGLQTLDLDSTQVTDLVPLAGLSALQTLYLDSTRVTDLRPLLSLNVLWDTAGEDGPSDPHFWGIWFSDTPATQADPELKMLSKIGDRKNRAQQTRAYLQTLPPLRQPEDTLAAPKAHKTEPTVSGFVFVSYAKEDRDEVEDLYDALKAAGLPIWWDQDIRTGQIWGDILEAKLAASALVLTVWSARSLRSHFVRDEAEYARREGKLAHISLDGVEPPMGFRGIQYVEMQNWDKTRTHRRFAKLERDLRDALGDRSDEHEP